MKGTYFTMNELKKLHIVQSVIDKKRTGKEAAKLLNISERQLWRLVKKVKNEGEVGIKHKNHFNKPKHAATEEFKDKIYKLKISNAYCDTNFSHFKELLEENENIFVSYSFIYKTLTEKGLISKKKHRKRKTHRLRQRKERFGEMIQTDGTPHDWFKDGNKYSLHGYIDDATGRVLGLYMCENECLMGYLEITRQMLQNYGSPQLVYSDKYSVFFPTQGQKLTIEEELEGKKQSTTQFYNILDTLGIELKAASTSQAKGRIERLWGTLQDRLITEFKLNNIKTIDEANKFLLTYINKHNKRFAIEPANPESTFIPLPKYIDLDLLLASKLTRVIDNAGTFTIKNKRFQIVDNNILPKSKVEILISHKLGIIALHKDKRYKVITIDNVPNTYSTINFNAFANKYSLEMIKIADQLLGENAKAYEPLLTSS